MSDVPAGTDIEVAHAGARLLGLPLLEQGENVARVMEARDGEGVLFPDVAVQEPRRASKTTSVWSVILGRAATRDRYRAVTTAQRGLVASRVLVEMAQEMIRHGNCVESREWKNHPDLPALFRSSGREKIVWPNGNEVWAVPPDPGAVRSAGADDILVDEGGELDPVKGGDFIDAVRPLQDTRGPLAQFILAGTPGKVRTGPFWRLLEQGRAGQVGIVDYSIRDDEDADDRNVWDRVHPGPSSGLTPMNVLEKRYNDLGAVAFAREYLCRWPFDSTIGAIDSEVWHAKEVPALALPEKFALGFDCCPDGSAAAICAAWRVDGAPHVALLAYRANTTWVAGEVRGIAKKHRAPVVADAIGANVPVIEALSRGRVLVNSPRFRALQGACQTFVSTLPVHQEQPDLERAVAAATWREVDGGRVFGRKASGTDISPLMSGVLALWQWDQTPERRSMAIMSA